MSERKVKQLRFVLAVLAVLFAPPFLVVVGMQLLFWLLHWLFPSGLSALTWLGIEGYVIISLVVHVSISTALMWVLVRKLGRPERLQFMLIAAATPFALPFLGIWPLLTASRLLYRLLPSTGSQLVSFFEFMLVLPGFLSMWLLSDMTRYVIVSLVALALTSMALIWLLARERTQVWRRGRLYLLFVASAAVLAFPFAMRYRPAVKTAPGVELRIVEQPGLLRGAVKWCQAAAEVRGECQYEPLGWKDQETLVYRKWCGGRYAEEGWQPGAPQPPRAYRLNTGEVSHFDGDLHTLWEETCTPSVCVLSALADRKAFEQGYHAGEYQDAFVSPDGRWIAFTAEHIYGPEDLLIISDE